jgi:tetratricopeptide (TPR) repeat protein
MNVLGKISEAMKRRPSLLRKSSIKWRARNELSIIVVMEKDSDHLSTTIISALYLEPKEIIVCTRNESESLKIKSNIFHFKIMKCPDKNLSLNKYAIDNCKYPWVLMLWAGDTIQRESKIEIETFIKSSDGFFFVQCIEDGFRSMQKRLFRKDMVKWPDKDYEFIRPEKDVKFIKSCIIKNRVGGCLSSLKSYIDSNMKNESMIPSFHYHSACIYSILNDYQSTLNHSEVYLSISSNDEHFERISALHMKAWSMIMSRKEHSKILDVIVSALAMNVSLPFFWNILGDIHLSLEKKEDAIECYKNAFEFGKLGDEYMNIVPSKNINYSIAMVKFLEEN